MVLDLKILSLVFIASAFIAASLVALVLPTRRWHEHLTAFFALTLLLVGLLALLAGLFLDLPLVELRSAFPLP